jgi:predicted dehydrogenase/threonine dehydrogenase-like Zn-dependent dehydrogenase
MMKQVVQGLGATDLEVVDVPKPSPGATEVLVAPAFTLLSKGTERAVRSLAAAGLAGKARARPELVRRVVDKARTEGIATTVRAVRDRLGDQMPLGYSGAGLVVEVGEAVSGLSPGQRVATGGAGHAELQVVAGHLAVPVPDRVADEEASFATVAAVALHGLRLADLGPGARVCVIGLGLLGQLTVRLGQAAGCDMAGIDLQPWTVHVAEAAGVYATIERGDDTTAAVLDWSKGLGVDAVIVTASTPSSDPVRRSPALVRDRGVLVVVGDVGVDLARPPFYEKELTVRFARSYGPGRYERSYEEWGVDYPVGYVRWTEGRNLQSFVQLVERGRITVRDLITHQFALEDAARAYEVIDRPNEQALGVQLTYKRSRSEERPRPLASKARRRDRTGVGLIGAGNFARSVLAPSLRQVGLDDIVAVASASGLAARRVADGFPSARAVEGWQQVIDDPAVDVVVIATPHDLHASLAVAALEAGKHVFCEKPLALTTDELAAVAGAWRASPGHLAVGFNRRHSPAVERVRRHFGKSRGPLVLTYRVNAGPLSTSHWYHDRRQGGRLLGEACHFVDTAAAIVDARVATVYATGSGREEKILDEDLVLTLRYGDGSVATISYASAGHPGTPKERVEVLGRGHSALIDDFRRVVLDDRQRWRGHQDKGHVAELRAFRAAVLRDRDTALTETALEASAATLAAAESLGRGTAVVPEDT